MEYILYNAVAALLDAQDATLLSVQRILIDHSGPEIVLVDVALLPAVRGRGIGTGLLEDLLAEAREAGRPVRLKVVLTNPARRLYERLGFVGLGDDGVYEQMEWRSDLDASKPG